MKLESPDVLNQPGASDGAVKIVDMEGVASVYQWSEAEYQWEHLGEAMAGPEGGSSGGSNNSGYDFNVDVDLGQGAPIPLRFNRSDDAYTVALQFIETNRLDMYSLPQILQYVENLLGGR